MPLSTADLKTLESHFEQGGVDQVLDFLEQRFRVEHSYFKLFEVLKMRCRHRLGLSLTYGPESESLTEPQQRQLEDGLLAACRDVGTQLMHHGQLAEGWMYLHPVGDRDLNESLIRSLTVTEDNLETILEIAFHQAAAPSYGYQLLIEHFGTCNAITTFDTQAHRFEKHQQQAMAEMLVQQLYRELCLSLVSVLERERQTATEPNHLTAILAEHPWLIEGGAFHIDTTHLASVMRIARVIEKPAELMKALELANYGHRLHPDFQYPSAPPFEDTYPDHAHFFRALLGQRVDEAVAHFRAKCESVDPNQHGTVAWETLANFLTRVGRRSEAIKVVADHVIGHNEPLGIAPQLLDIPETSDQWREVQNVCTIQGDLLGTAVAMLKSSTDQS